MEKEFLYVGYYKDTEEKILLKIGTTNDLKRRQNEHNRNYRKATKYTMPQEESFHYLWHLPLSKYNTLRYEDKNRTKWQEEGVGKFVRNDRFVLSENVAEVTIKIRKNYTIPLSF